MAEAFALREEYTGTVTGLDDDGEEITVDKFRGASIAMRDGSTFDVALALEEGDGVIVSDDPMLIVHLEHAGFLKSVPVPDNAPKVTSLESLGVRQLRDTPEGKRITGIGGMNKDEIIERIERARRGADPNVALVKTDDGYIEDPGAGAEGEGATT